MDRFDNYDSIRLFIKENVNFNLPLSNILTNLEQYSKTIEIPNAIVIANDKINNVNVEWYEPEVLKDDNIIIYYHGGGYCIGIYNNLRKYISEVAISNQRRVLLLDYRLAPQNQFPDALMDSFSLYEGLLEKGYNPNNIVCLADSSGCGLCLSSMFKFQEKKIELPAALVFVCPVLDWTRSGESHKTKMELDPYYVKPEFCFEFNYIQNEDRENPLISPIFGEIKNLPPILIHAADYDIFVNDAIQLAKKIEKDNTMSSIKVFEKLCHNFHMMSDMIPDAKVALNEIYDFIDNCFNKTS